MCENEFEKANQETQKKVQEFYQCDYKDVEFPSGLNQGTTWESGQDFWADYRVGDYKGVAIWSTIDQIARVSSDH